MINSHRHGVLLRSDSLHANEVFYRAPSLGDRFSSRSRVQKKKAVSRNPTGLKCETRNGCCYYYEDVFIKY